MAGLFCGKEERLKYDIYSSNAAWLGRAVLAPFCVVTSAPQPFAQFNASYSMLEGMLRQD